MDVEAEVDEADDDCDAGEDFMEPIMAEEDAPGNCLAPERVPPTVKEAILAEVEELLTLFW